LDFRNLDQQMVRHIWLEMETGNKIFVSGTVRFSYNVAYES